MCPVSGCLILLLMDVRDVLLPGSGIPTNTTRKLIGACAAMTDSKDETHNSHHWIHSIFTSTINVQNGCSSCETATGSCSRESLQWRQRWRGMAGRRMGHIYIDANSSQKFSFIVKMDSVPVRYRVARTLVATPWPRPTPTNLNLQRRGCSARISWCIPVVLQAFFAAV